MFVYQFHEPQVVAAKVAELDALISQVEAQKRKLVKAHCRGEQLPEGVVMIWKKDLDKMKYNDKAPAVDGYSAYYKLDVHQRPKDLAWINQCANCSIYYKQGETLNKHFSSSGGHVQWQVERPQLSDVRPPKRSPTGKGHEQLPVVYKQQQHTEW